MPYHVRPGRHAAPTGAAAWLAALTELVLPAACGGCAEAGSPWCPACAAALAALAASGPRRTSPQPCPPGLGPVWAAAPYAGVLRAAVVAWKDGGRRDLEVVLAPLLAAALGRALAADPVLAGVLARGDGPVLVVPVPSSAAAVRRRGDVPLTALLRRAVALTGQPAHAVRVASALRLRRRVADQAGLGRLERAANLEHAIEVRGRWCRVVHGAVAVAVDDVVTTGATLAETSRALRLAGARHVAPVSLAATQRHVIPLGLQGFSMHRCEVGQLEYRFGGTWSSVPVWLL